MIVRDKDPAEEDVPTVLFPAKDAEAWTYAFARRQRPKTRPPSVKPSPNVPSGERADRDRLAPRREPLPAAERLLLLGRQRLAAPLLAHRAAGAEPEVEVVEDLGGLSSAMRSSV